MNYLSILLHNWTKESSVAIFFFENILVNIYIFKIYDGLKSYRKLNTTFKLKYL